MEISNLSGYFNGYNWTEGPISITIDNGKISSIEESTGNNGDIDGSGCFVSPPFVDGHTHLIFASDRSFELSLKIEGKSYAEILEMGGGIYHTVEHTRNASDDELLKLVLQRLDIMQSFGTMTVEAKSGYGLNAEEELRLLKILNKANQKHKVKIYPTYCGAHALPKDKPRNEYVEEVISIIPEIKKKNLATSTDIFCDRGAFNIEETEKIMKASTYNDLPVRVHAEELQYTGIGKIATSKFNALSVDHLLNSRLDDFQVYSKSNTTAMFMPAATIGLFTNNKPCGWKNSKVKIGLGSDYNPNNLVMSMQTAIRLAVFLYRMEPKKAFAASISGSFNGITGENLKPLSVGSKANLLVINVSSIDKFTTRLDQNLVRDIIIDGRIT